MKNKSGGKIMTKYVALSAKTYSYLIDGNSEDERVKGIKKCVIKKNLYLKVIKTV